VGGVVAIRSAKNGPGGCDDARPGKAGVLANDRRRDRCAVGDTGSRQHDLEMAGTIA
jgi:hypothetical protein